MTTTTNRRTPKRSPRAAPSPAPVVEEREPRGARRKRETRARLLDAALRLMAEKGMEGVAINEITEAADVGFGSFYNHFESKEAIYSTLVDNVFEEFADMLDRLGVGISDPAEIVALSVRRTILRAQHDPVWGRFLIREGLSAGMLSRGLGQRLLRDIRNGIEAKRFVLSDPLIGFLAVGGTILSVIAAELNYVAPGAIAAGQLDKLGFDTRHLPERTAAMLLQTLGLKRAEAEKITARPLPIVEEPVEED